MNRALPVALVGAFLAVLLASSACDDEECCPVSDTFTCTDFSFGGARSLQPGGSCETGYTDNLPVVTGKKTDAKGCTYWERDSSGARTCGVAPRFDAGRDTSPEASSDAAGPDAADASSLDAADAASLDGSDAAD